MSLPIHWSHVIRLDDMAAAHDGSDPRWWKIKAFIATAPDTDPERITCKYTAELMSSVTPDLA